MLNRPPLAKIRSISFILFVLFISLSPSLYAINYTSTGSGNWTTPATWSPSGIPGAADNVTILAGHIITMNGNPGNCRQLIVSGTASWNQLRTTNIGAGGLTVSNGGILSGTTTGTLTDNGTFTVPAGAAAIVGGINFTVIGSTTISGTLTLNSAAGIKTFANLIIAAAGAWNNSASSDVTINGNLQNNGTFTAGTGYYTLAGGGNTISGSSTALPNINCTGTYTNNTTLSVSTDLNDFSGGGGTFINGTGATLNLGGTISVGTFTANAASNTVNYNGAATQTVYAITYYNLVVTKPSGVAANVTAATTVSNNLTVTSGTLSIGGVTFNNNGASSMASISGMISFTNIFGAKRFRNITINPGGQWNSAVARNYNISGNLVNNGTFTANNGQYSFFSASGSISGSVPITFRNVRCNGSYTNNGTITITNRLNGGGSWIQGTTGSLYLSLPDLNFSVTIFDASAAGNTVVYSLAGNQSIRNGTASTYHHLTIAGTGTKSLIANVIVNGNLNISSTLDVSASNFNIILGGNWNNSGIFNPGNGTATVTLNGITQSVIKATNETFNHLTCNNTGTKLLGCPITVNNNLTINAGSTLDVSASDFAVTVKGNFSNSGTFVPHNGTVTLNGTVAQSISGTTITTFRNLALNNAAGATLGADANLMGTLTLSAGTFTTTGRIFTLLSGATSTARIAAIPAGADIAGNITMQRYISSSVTSWRMIGPAVSGRTLADWNASFTMSGFPGSNYPSFSFCSVYTYDETKPGIKDTGWVKPTSISNPVPLGKGILAYIGPVPLTMNISGPPGKFAQSFALTYTNSGLPADDGWNLISNPYPSSVDWDAVTWTKTNLNNAIYIWNPNLQQYSSYVGGIGTNGGSNIVPSSQAFWVQANAAGPVLTAVESVKSATDQAFMKHIQTQAAQQIYNLTLNLNGNNQSDQTVIRFDANASTGFDGNYDAYKFAGDWGTPYFASVIPSTDLSINSIPALTSDVTVPLRVRVGVSGSYTIKKDSISNLPGSSCIVLEDLLTGVSTDLRNFNAYTFTISDTTTTPRFLIHISAPFTKERFAAKCNGSSDGMAVAKGSGSAPWTYVWKNAANVVIRTSVNLTTADTLKNIAAGIYSVEVNGSSSICSMVSDTFMITQPPALAANAVVQHVSCNGMNNGMITTNTSGGTPPYSYLWYDNSTLSYHSSLAPGNYPVVISDANGCTTSSAYTITQPAPVTASFTASSSTVFLSQSGMAVFTNNSTGAIRYEWDYGDGSLPDSIVNPVHYYSYPGTYTVTLVAYNTSCSDTARFNIYVINDVSGVAQNSLGGAINVINVPGGADINFDLPLASNVKISLWSELGQQLIEAQRLVSRETIHLDFSGFSEGIYFLRITDGKNTYSKKLTF